MLHCYMHCGHFCQHTANVIDRRNTTHEPLVLSERREGSMATVTQVAERIIDKTRCGWPNIEN